MDRVIASYKYLLEDRTFLGSSLVCGFSSAGMFAYIASAPFVFINIYKLPPQQFGWLFGVIAAGMIGVVSGERTHAAATFRSGSAAGRELVQIRVGRRGASDGRDRIRRNDRNFAPVFVYMCAAGFVFPNGNAIAMMRHGNMAGTASALLGTISSPSPR